MVRVASKYWWVVMSVLFMVINKLLNGSQEVTLIAIPLLCVGVKNLLELKAAEDEKNEATNKVKSLVVSELVCLFARLMDGYKLVDAAISTLQAGGPVGQVNLKERMSYPMPLTENLGVKLLLLSLKQTDVLATLKYNLALMDMEMETVTNSKMDFGLLKAKSVMSSIKHNMLLLAEAFEQFAPDRQLKIDGEKEQLASDLLHKFAS